MTELELVRAVDFELGELPAGTSVQVTDGVVRIRLVGVIPFSVSLEVIQRIVDEPRIPPGTPIIVDLLQQTQTPPSLEAAHAFVKALSAVRVQLSGKVAVVTDDTVRYAFSRMVSLIAEFQAISMSVFRDLASAERFIRGE